MKLTAISRILCASAAVGMLSTVAVSAATIHMGNQMGHSRYQLVSMGAHGGQVVNPNFTCPGSYNGCASPTKSSPFTDGWCVSTTGTCSSGLVGTWNWTSVVNAMGKGSKKVISSWSPDPGNPSTNTISDKRRKAKGTKIIATVVHSTCEVTNGTCFSNFATYGVTN